MAFLTVIVPFYNRKDFLPSCITSLMGQSFNDFTCIMIDDCSTDDSWQLCKELTKHDNRFVLMQNEKNLGASKTREVALKQVQTKCIVFMDSDDLLPEDGLEKLVAVKQQTGAKLIIGGRKYTDLTGNEICYVYNSDVIYDPVEYFMKARGEFLSKYSSLWALWAKLYDVDLFDDVIFPVFQEGEDQCINLQICSKLEGNDICFTEECVYIHRDNPSSIVYSYSKNLPFEMKEWKNMIWRIWCRDFLKNHNLYDKFECLFEVYVYMLNVAKFFLIAEKVSTDDIKHARYCLKKYGNFIKSIKLKNKRMICLLLFLKIYCIAPTFTRLANKMRKKIKYYYKSIQKTAT